MNLIKNLSAVFLVCVMELPAQEPIPVEVIFPSGTGIMAEPFSLNSAGLLTVPCKYLNTSDKTIKYLGVEIRALNPVGDIMEPELGGILGRITGPIAPGQSYAVNNNFATYYRGLVASVKIRVVGVEFMDGTVNKVPTEFKEYSIGPDEHSKSVITWTIIITAASVILGLILGSSL